LLTDSPRFAENQALQEILQSLNGAMVELQRLCRLQLLPHARGDPSRAGTFCRESGASKNPARMQRSCSQFVVFPIWSTPGATVELQRWCRLQLLTMRASGDAHRTRTFAAAWCVHRAYTQMAFVSFAENTFATEVKGVCALSASSRIKAAREGQGSCGAGLDGLHPSQQFVCFAFFL